MNTICNGEYAVAYIFYIFISIYKYLLIFYKRRFKRETVKEAV